MLYSASRTAAQRLSNRVARLALATSAPRWNEVRRTLSSSPYGAPPAAGGGGYSGGGGSYHGGQSGPSSPPLRAYPQYTVYGENTVLALKLIPPIFRMGRNNVLQLDTGKRGRILLEWTPRLPDGSISRQRDDQMRFGLSPEEIALLLDQVPQNGLELTRRIPTASPEAASMASASMGDGGGGDKVMQITPQEAGAVSFAVHYEINGVQQQSQPYDTNVGETEAPAPVAAPSAGPMEVVVALGEFRVMCELMRTSIPLLTGWSPMVDISIERQLELELSQNGGGRQGQRNDWDY